MNELTRKDIEWHWGSDQQQAFNALKDCITSNPILIHPNPKEQYDLEVDASGFAVGVVCALIANLIPLAITWGDYRRDGLEVIGFPLTFRSLGTSGIKIDASGLLADIALGLAVATAFGIIWTNPSEPDSNDLP